VTALTTKEQMVVFLRRTIANLTENPLLEQQLEEDQNLQSVGMDSLQIMNLVVEIEMKSNIEFDDDELVMDNFETIHAITSQIGKKRGVQY